MEEGNGSKNDRSQSQMKASWIFGSLLLLFFVGVFIFAPKSLVEYKQRMLAFFAALLAGLFTFFFTGDISLKLGGLKSKFGKVTVKATGGIAAFTFVLVWWFSPIAPVKVQSIEERFDRIIIGIEKIETNDITAKVTFSFRFDETLLPINSDIFTQGAKLELVASTSESSLTLSDASRWGGHLSSKTELHLSSAEQKSDINVRRTADGSSTKLIRTYSNFTGELGSFTRPESWIDSSIAGRFEVYEANRWLRELRRVGNSRISRKLREEEFNKFYNISSETLEEWRNTDYSVQPLPIRATLDIFVRGKLVASSSGIVTKVREWDEDVRGLHIIKFASTRISHPPN